MKLLLFNVDHWFMHLSFLILKSAYIIVWTIIDCKLLYVRLFFFSFFCFVCVYVNWIITDFIVHVIENLQWKVHKELQ